MKRLLSTFVVVCVVTGLCVAYAQGAEKDVTVKGDLQCAKCVAKDKDAKGCQTVLITKENDKVVTYSVVSNEVTKKYEENCCKKATPVTITGSVKVKDGKNVLTPTKIES